MVQNELTLKIREIRYEIMALSGMVERAMRDSVEALRDHDFQASETIFQEDVKINRKRFELEGSIMSLIAARQPETRNLRALASMLEMCAELERMGDYAKGLAVINLRSEGPGMPKTLLDLHHMANQAVNMLHRAMSSFAAEDVESAKAIIQEDSLIDALYREIYYEAMDAAFEDARNIEKINFVLWCAHNIERFADRVTNICERTIFVVTGVLDEHHAYKEDVIRL